jgi:hypothetical protein
VRSRRRSRSLLRPGFTTSQSVYCIPLADSPFDFVFSNSLLTHFPERAEELSARTLSALAPRRDDAAAFQHRTPARDLRHPPHVPAPHGDALIESEAQPQAAVASHTDFLFGLCRKRGNDGFACNKHPAFRHGRRYFVPLLTAHTAIKFFDLAQGTIAEEYR